VQRQHTASTQLAHDEQDIWTLFGALYCVSMCLTGTRLAPHWRLAGASGTQLAHGKIFYMEIIGSNWKIFSANSSQFQPLLHFTHFNMVFLYHTLGSHLSYRTFFIGFIWKK